MVETRLRNARKRFDLYPEARKHLTVEQCDDIYENGRDSAYWNLFNDEAIAWVKQYGSRDNKKNYGKRGYWVQQIKKKPFLLEALTDEELVEYRAGDLTLSMCERMKEYGKRLRRRRGDLPEMPEHLLSRVKEVRPSIIPEDLPEEVKDVLDEVDDEPAAVESEEEDEVAKAEDVILRKKLTTSTKKKKSLVDQIIGGAESPKKKVVSR